MRYSVNIWNKERSRSFPVAWQPPVDPSLALLNVKVHGVGGTLMSLNCIYVRRVNSLLYSF